MRKVLNINIQISCHPGRYNIDDRVLDYWHRLCCVKYIFGCFTKHVQVQNIHMNNIINISANIPSPHTHNSNAINISFCDMAGLHEKNHNLIKSIFYMNKITGLN